MTYIIIILLLSFDLCCDCIVGIIDPLRDDVKDAVATAQRAGTDLLPRYVL
jgi:magnesium-transporting ATPase (P-type)